MHSAPTVLAGIVEHNVVGTETSRQRWNTSQLPATRASWGRIQRIGRDSLAQPFMLGSALMRNVRRWVGRIAAGWIALHFAILVSTPTALCVTTPDHRAGAECTCDHAGAEQCPMHHARTKTNPSSCSCRSTSDPLGTVAASLLGPSAVLTRVVSLDRESASSRMLSPTTTHSIDADDIPDAPPPRA